MTPRHFLALILGFAVFSSPFAFAQYGHIPASGGDGAKAAAKLVDEKFAADISSRIERSGADVGVAFRTLDGKMEWFSRADEVFHAASTMKVPVMIELFHQVREGKLKLDDPLSIQNEFHSLVDGSVYTLDATDDSESDLYKAVGQIRTLSQLCELMMRGLLILLEAIAKGQAVDPDSSRQMVDILTRQKFNEAIPAGLPAGTRVAHKTGELTKIHHDAAIVYAPRPFVLVLLVRGMAESKDSAALMADITRRIYQSAQ